MVNRLCKNRHVMIILGKDVSLVIRLMSIDHRLLTRHEFTYLFIMILFLVLKWRASLQINGKRPFYYKSDVTRIVHCTRTNLVEIPKWPIKYTFYTLEFGFYESHNTSSILNRALSHRLLKLIVYWLTNQLSTWVAINVL